MTSEQHLFSLSPGKWKRIELNMRHNQHLRLKSVKVFVCNRLHAGVASARPDSVEGRDALKRRPGPDTADWCKTNTHAHTHTPIHTGGAGNCQRAREWLKAETRLMATGRDAAQEDDGRRKERKTLSSFCESAGWRSFGVRLRRVTPSPHPPPTHHPSVRRLLSVKPAGACLVRSESGGAGHGLRWIEFITFSFTTPGVWNRSARPRSTERPTPRFKSSAVVNPTRESKSFHMIS